MSEDMSPALEAATLKQTRAETQKTLLEIRKLELAIASDERYHDTHLAGAYQHRIYSFWEPVTNGTVKDAIDTIGNWARRGPGEKITVLLNSPGGSVLSGLAFYDYLRELVHAGTPVETVTQGMAASMGGILLQAGSTRVASRNAWLLIHEISSMAFGKATDVEDELVFMKRLQAQTLDILAERSTLSAAQIKRRWTRRDWWLNATEMKELGFVDEVRA